MAVSEERNQVARELNDLIDLIAQDIFRSWNLNFQEIKDSGREQMFDHKLISKIYEDDETREKFLEYMEYTRKNYGGIWEQFSAKEQRIIALKESKIFW